jgi:hypothetical protein
MADPVGEAFEIHVVGEETCETFTGKFRAKQKLSWADQLAISRYCRELLGVNAAEADVYTQHRAMVISELSARLSESPEWWRTSRGGLDLVDDNVAMAVYDKAVEVRTKWLEVQKKKGEEAKKALAEKQAK